MQTKRWEKRAPEHVSQSVDVEHTLSQRRGMTPIPSLTARHDRLDRDTERGQKNDEFSPLKPYN